MPKNSNSNNPFSETIFTSESVSEGHPDKIADQISDAILDACLEQDPESRVACETFCTHKKIIISGEITSKAKVDYKKVAREVLLDIGHTKETGLDPNIEIEVIIQEQAKEIKEKVDGDNDDLGAGDQGIIFGYATDETPEFMPLPIVLAHNLVRLASKMRKNGEFKWARPDMKSQVSYNYSTNKIDTMLMSIQHNPFKNDKDKKAFKKFVRQQIMIPIARKYKQNEDFKFIINSGGNWTIGGLDADTGLTGRKIIVDTYGGAARHGGGAFSGKDPSKVDRSAAYGARYIARNIVSNGWAKRCEIQLSYAIGKKDPVSIDVFTFNTSLGSDADNKKILDYIVKNYVCSPQGFIEHLKLKRPIYRKTSIYGHFGRSEFSWEQHFDSTKEIIKPI